MKKITLFLAACLLSVAALAQPSAYQSLDPNNPIQFGGDHIVYQGQKIMLGEKAFFIDGQLSDAEAARYPYVFNSFQDAADRLKNGTEAEPMTLYIAPWVYWIDDPDDPAIRRNPQGGAPLGMTIECEWLRFHGLNPNAENVVLAVNRGQTQGAVGNFTMFRLVGDGTSTENITFGNYCNIDLVFPLKPELNRAKRANAIVQAQLIFTNGDKIVARNTRFVSRLNLCPFSGGKRVLFDNCYFECTDDSLCGTGVYLNCTVGLYASKPFGSTSGTGAVFLNSDMEVRGRQSEQFINKVGNQVALVDVRFHAPNDDIYLGWTGDVRDNLRCYQYNVSLNGKAAFMGTKHPWATVDMTGKRVLDAYRVEYNGQVIYNTYNLLRGDDDWDPMGVKPLILAAEQANGKTYTNIPTYLRVTPINAGIESGVTTATLETTELRFGNYPIEKEAISWRTEAGSEGLVDLRRGENGAVCEVVGTNQNDETRTLMVIANTPGGLESASVVTVAPTFLDPPAFTRDPEIITTTRKGMLSVSYGLDLVNRLDESLITWYRCTDTQGSNPLPVSVSRLARPEFTYELTPGDAGHYIMVTVEPKHLRSDPGTPKSAVTGRIAENQIGERNFRTDFRNFPSANQPQILPGTWTLDCFKPKDDFGFVWDVTPDRDAWFYGERAEATEHMGFIQSVRGARMLYTPVDGNYGDMTVSLLVDPFKTAGQGFGSATGQYMDIYIQFDTRTLSGYGLRIMRTTKFDRAVDFILMKYENGVATELTAPVSATCYRNDCRITVKIEGNTLSAQASCPEPGEINDPRLVKEVNMQATVAPSRFGGTGIQHTGTAGGNASMLREMSVEWR